MGEIVSCCHPQDVMRLIETQLIERYHRRDSLNPSPPEGKNEPLSLNSFSATLKL